ncbi:MAG TPA: hypothetical protein VME40_18710 [Caulobacteraceae bacterium]|nr:hypothetical protein [Caulobacteraceae bacterium]
MSLLALAGLALAGPARADPPNGEDAVAGAPAIDAGAFRIAGEVLYARAGTPVTLFHYFAVGPDCEAAPAVLSLTQAPAHGHVAFSDGAQPPVSGLTPLWTRDDPRAHCTDRLVATRDAVYIPDADFAGHDELVVTFQEAGASFTDAIEVNVVRIKPTPPLHRIRLRNAPPAKTGRPGD